MTKKPLIAIAAVSAFAVPAGAFVAADASAQSSAKPRVSSLDVDLNRGNVLRVSVEASRARTVKLTYGGKTKTAKLVDRDDDGDNEYAATFKPRSGDGANDRVRVRVNAKGSGDSTTRTLSDRIDDERRDDDGDDDRFDD